MFWDVEVTLVDNYVCNAVHAVHTTRHYSYGGNWNFSVVKASESVILEIRE